MDSITIHVGGEEKEISGLTRKTTCMDILQALIRDKQSTNGSFKVKPDDCAQEEHDFSLPANKPLQELAQSYAIVETWRGCDKPLPPRTRILAVWQAWGSEQGHVRFSLKKSRHIRYREQRKDSPTTTTTTGAKNNDDERQRRPKLSHGQKRRIRRSMLQYQRAVLIQQTKGGVNQDGNNNAAGRGPQPWKEVSGRMMRNEVTTTFTLSEEQFVDGVVTGPECLLQLQTAGGKFIQSALDNSDLNSELDAYQPRRHRHHHRRSQPLDSRRNNASQTFASAPANLAVVHRDSDQRRRSGEDTTSTTSSNDDDDVYRSHSDADEDADDEKSTIMASAQQRQQLAFPLPCVVASGEYMTKSNSAAMTDSSCGTTSCSETSNTSGSSSFSGTSSSETSSGADYFAENSFLAQRAAAVAQEAAAARSAADDKPKSGGAVKLFKKVAAQSILGSFRKKKRQAPLPPVCSTSSSIVASEAAAKRLQNKPAPNAAPSDGKRAVVSFAPQLSDETKSRHMAEAAATNPVNPPCDQKTRIPSNVDSLTDVDATPPSTTQDEPLTILESTKAESEEQSVEEWKKTVTSQEDLLRSHLLTERALDLEIEQIESEIHKWRTEAHGKNYVQDAYLSATESGRESRVTNEAETSWLATCRDSALLTSYIDACQRVVDAQMHIEECKRRHDIVLQDMQDEVWRSSSRADANGAITQAASALGIVTSGAGSRSSDDDETASRVDGLLVSSAKSSKRPGGDDGVRTVARSGDVIVDVEKFRAELEANLYLSLRLSSELEDVEYRNVEKLRLIETKCDRVVYLVREMAASSEGISPQLWAEYGELLASYDLELALHDYRTLGEIVAPSPFEMTCGRCGVDGGRHAPSPNLSELPLPAPALSTPATSSARSTPLTPLLPMYPIPTCAEMSDYDDDAESAKTTSRRRLSASDDPLCQLRPSTPDSRHHQAKFLLDPPHHHHQPIATASNATDDSGNASAGSISSFTSADDAGAGSCDGGSPRPTMTGADVASSVTRAAGDKCADWRSRFVFPSPPHHHHHHHQLKNRDVDAANSAPKASRCVVGAPKKAPPPIPSKSALLYRSAPHDSSPMRQAVGRKQPQPLPRTRRLSSGSIVSASPPYRAGRRGSDPHPRQRLAPNAKMFAPTEATATEPLTYDNDSDTGLSSLHSADSDLIMYSETLV